jgi:site-specific recombinase XerD
MLLAPHMKKKVRLKDGRFNEKSVVVIQFPYDTELIQVARGLKARWNPDTKVWYLPKSPGVVHRIFQSFIGKAFIDYSGVSRTSDRSNSEFPQKRVQRLQKNVQPGIEHEIDRFKRYMRSRQYSERTIEVYCSLLELFFSYFPSLSVKDVERDHIEKFMSDYLFAGGYANSTRRQVIGAIKLFFQRIEDKKFDTEDLLLPFKENRLPVVLSKSEVRQILETIKNFKHYVLLSLIYAHGLRIGEALNLKIKDLDFIRGQVQVQRAKGRKWRNIPMSNRSSNDLQKYLKKFKPTTFVFEGAPGKQYSRTSARVILNRAIKESKVEKKITLHTLRHSYATHLLESGVDIRYIQALLGHSSPNTTMIYTHVRSEHLDTIINPFDDLG